ATVGVPPDAYAAEGQDWGLPVPRWEEMRSAGDPWLRQRAERAAELYDVFRVDHVVGLYRTYARPLDKGPPFFIPSDEPRQREHQLRQPMLAPLRGPSEKKFNPQTKTALLELAFSSASDALLIPITDALGWQDRMNAPGTVGTHNWTFRLPWSLPELFSAPVP